MWTRPDDSRRTSISCHEHTLVGRGEHLEGGLLGGEAGGQALRVDAGGRPAIGDLALREEPLEIALAVGGLERLGHVRHGHEIEAHPDRHDRNATPRRTAAASMSVRGGREWCAVVQGGLWNGP